MLRIAVFTLLLLDLRADDPGKPGLRLAVLLAKGSTWRVSQQVQLTCAGVPASGRALVPLTLAEQYTDACLRDDAGSPREVRRTIGSSRLAVGTGGSGGTAAEGLVLLLRPGAASQTEITMEKIPSRGRAPEMGYIGGAPVVPESLLLPVGEIEVGGKWEVPDAAVAALQRCALSGVGNAIGSTREQLAELLNRLDARSAPGVTTVTATLESRQGGVAKITFVGTAKPVFPPVPDVVISGSLSFSIAAGMPTRLDWRSKTVHRVPAGEKTPAYTEEWALVRISAAR